MHVFCLDRAVLLLLLLVLLVVVVVVVIVLLIRCSRGSCPCHMFFGFVLSDSCFE